MSIDHPDASRPLPDRPNLRHLKDQAKELLKTGAAASLTDAQFKIARRYGFSSWPKLKAHIDSFEEIGQLKQAIDTNDSDRVKTMMTRNPTLHSAPVSRHLHLISDLADASPAAYSPAYSPACSRSPFNLISSKILLVVVPCTE